MALDACCASFPVHTADLHALPAMLRSAWDPAEAAKVAAAAPVKLTAEQTGFPFWIALQLNSHTYN